MTSVKQETPPPPSSPQAPRRSFMTAVLAGTIGAIVGLVPLVSGLIMFFDPLRRKGAAGNFQRVTTLGALSNRPQLFPISQDRVDAWNFYPDEPVGAVYIRRIGEQPPKIQVLHATCPHLGCAVAFSAEGNKFQCPCHNSAFEIDGAMIQPCASPRDLDELNWKLVNANGQEEVWVEFQNFKTGIAEKQVKA
ncbi:MAG: Rieske 2Fe-2S domain-containing protein [Pirellulales bacterium]|nr:Rieske 2Fe-2S domain-containing protein [Pirellulales bacterium]